MDDSYFEKIPLWDGTSNAFDILADDINGRIPVTRLENWQDFTNLLETEFFNQSKTQLIFRGHRRFDWNLMPTLGRVTESGIIDQQLADQQLDYFKRAVRGRLSDASLVMDEEEDELWSVGQHHGLMTPLLDWTYSPYVALFFAFYKEDSEEEKDNPYRTVYVLNKTFVSDDELCPEIRMFEPRKDDHGRLVNQAGLFTFSPYGSTIENKLIDTLGDNDFPDDELRSASLKIDDAGDVQDEMVAGVLAKYICKIYIKNEGREGCMRHLRRMNVHHASLFPDLIGAAQYCNLMVAEERRAYEIEQSAIRVDFIESDSEIFPFIPDSATEPDIAEVEEIAKILDHFGDNKVEPGRVQFISEHLSNELTRRKVVDWRVRDAALATMRASIRIALRKYGYPAGPVRDVIVGAIMKMLIESETDKQ